MNKEEKICRLCLTIINCKSYVVNNVRKHMIGVLLLKVDLSATDNPVICRSCAKKLQKYFDFMTACVKANRPFRFASAAGDTNGDCLCRVCKQSKERELVISVMGFEKKSDLIREMLMKCMPELNCGSIADFFICRHCLDSLNGYFTFMTTCQSIEGKIKEYRQTKHVTLDKQLEPSKNVQTFSLDMELPNVGKGTNIIKKEENLNEIDEAVNIAINYEYIVKEDIPEVDEYMVESDRFCDNTLPQSTEDSSDLNPFKCEFCSYETKYEGRFKRHHKVHKNVSEIRMYQCEICPFKAKKKYYLNVHMVTHGLPDLPVFKCDSCPYEARHKKYLNRHLLTHKEEQMYNCAKCSYKTSIRPHYRKHLLTHETKIYKCNSCPYETKQSKHFTKHLLVHESKLKVTVYSCEKCPYKTMEQRHLTLHELTHKDVSETTAYKCELCPYITKWKHSFNRHLLVHKDESGVATYKCELCPYESKRKFHMRLHLVKHKDWSAVVTFRCGYCSYETKLETDLNKHFKSHQDKVKLMIFCCDLCNFEARERLRFHEHLLTHLVITQVAL